MAPPHVDTSARLSYAEMVGRVLIALGVVLVIIGLAVEYAPRLPFRIGRLPGDIYIHRNNTTFYFPIVTCILVSVVLTLVLWIFNRR
jgi:hypothetical protein